MARKRTLGSAATRSRWIKVFRERAALGDKCGKVELDCRKKLGYSMCEVIGMDCWEAQVRLQRLGIKKR